MKNIFKISLVLLTLTLFFSCEQGENLKEKSTTIVEQLKALNFNTDGLELIKQTLPNGKTREMYQVENDILLSEEQINDMSNQIGQATQTKQWHTFALPNYGTYTIVGETTSSVDDGVTGLSSAEQNALSISVNNFNSLNLSGLTLNLVFSDNPTVLEAADLVIFKDTLLFGKFATADFPNNDGKTGRFIALAAPLDNLNIALKSRVITHELGHTLGLRHSDWFSRESCAQTAPNSVFNEGAYNGNINEAVNHIPGTPYGFDPSSIFNACSNGVDNSFNENDIIALNYLFNY